jgi:hypothetical protein
MGRHIPGASLWEQVLYASISSHVAQEEAIVDEYRKLSESAPSAAFRYLAALILQDEVRHHRLFLELAQSIKSFSEVPDAPGPMADLRDLGVDKDRALPLTRLFLEIEREDLKELKRIAKSIKPVRKTTLWSLVVELMEDDTKKHIRILEFIEDRLRHPVM